MMTRRHKIALLLLSFFAFISLGLPDAVIGVAWPSVRRTFSLEIGTLGWLITTGMIGYVSASFASGWLTDRLGVGRLLLLSSLSIVIALGGYSISPNWPTMVILGLLSGVGAGAIDAAINAFAAHRFSPRVLNWVHACYGIGATCGPMLMTFILANQLSWRICYAILAAVIAMMSIGFAMTIRWWEEDGNDSTTPTDGAALADASSDLAQNVTAAGALSRPMVWAQIVLFFLYTGLEAAVGQWGFSILTESRGIDMRTAGVTIGIYWAGITVGRVMFGFLAHRISASTLLRIALILSPIFAGLICLRLAPIVTMIAIALLGLSIAPIFPLLISLTPARVGKAYASHSIGFQVGAASLGVAGISATAGILAQHISLEVIPPYLFCIAVAVWVIYEISNLRRRVGTGARAAVVAES